MPGEVKAQTAHSYAYNKWLKIRGSFDRIPRLSKDIIQEVLKKDKKLSKDTSLLYTKHKVWHTLHDMYTSSKLVLDTFCEELKLKFEDTYDGIDKAREFTIYTSNGSMKQVFGLKINEYAYIDIKHIDAFKVIYKEHEKRKQYTDSMYLKSAAYSPKASGDEWDYLFFDEAQDSNIFMLKLLEKQNIRKRYFIGDERQCIYNFGGANENIFKTKSFDKVYKLTKSFRFDSGVAKLANLILRLDSSQKCYGTPQIHPTNLNSYARLYRTNAALFCDALTLAYEAKLSGFKLKLDFMKGVGKDDSSAYQDMLAFLSLFYKYTNRAYWYKNMNIWPKEMPDTLKLFEKRLIETEKFFNAYNRFFNVYNEFYDALTEDMHHILAIAKDETHFVEKYNALQESLSYYDYDRCITMITMHRSKGLEWDIVDIAESVKLSYTDVNGVLRKSPDRLFELNLAYVAITRARKKLNAEILKKDLLSEAEYFRDVDFVIDVDKDRTLQEVNIA